MSAREICRLEGIQFFSDGCRVFDWLGFPLWHTPHSIKWRQQACKQCVHTDTGTDTHRDTWTHWTEKNTERQTAQQQHVQLKEDTMPGWKTGITAFSKASDLKTSQPFADDTVFYLPKNLKHCYASSAWMIQNIDLLSNPKVVITNLNHCRTTLVVVTKLKVGTEAFYGPFVCFGKKDYRLRKQVSYWMHQIQ